MFGSFLTAVSCFQDAVDVADYAADMPASTESTGSEAWPGGVRADRDVRYYEDRDSEEQQKYKVRGTR